MTGRGTYKVSTINPNLRKVRLIQWSLIASVLIFAGIAESVCGRGNGDWTLRHWLVTGSCLWAVTAGFRLRRHFLRRSTEALAKDAVNLEGLRQWEVGNVIGLAMAAGVAMWGLVVRYVLGGAFWQSSLFYAAGIFLLMLWTPREPIRALSN